MKGSIKFYINFIREVELHPCLYDYSHEDYGNHRVLEYEWNKIGEKFNENGSLCKEKWKSIRTSYVRNIRTLSKSNSKGSRKVYYLAPYLQFLHPFTKHSSKNTKLQVPLLQNNSESDEESLNTIKIPDYDDEEMVDIIPQSSTNGNKDLKEYTKQKPINAFEICDVENFSPKKVKFVSETVATEKKSDTLNKDPRELHLMNLLPYIQSMTQKQHLTFQKEVADLILKILYPNSTSKSVTEVVLSCRKSPEPKQNPK